MIRDFLIHLLGGYTKKEWEKKEKRIERRYQGLLASKTDHNTPIIVNEYILRVLEDLEKYAKTTLYGIVPESWARKMFHVIHNNKLRLVARYLHSGVIYKIDTTLDEPDQFKNILKEDNIESESSYLEED